jgi:phosphoglycerate kinase
MSTAFKTLDDYDFKGKRVLVRADLNVPVAKGKVTDETRIERLVPTLRDITKAGGKAIVLSHFGRPKDGPDPKMSLKQVVPSLKRLTGHRVTFLDTPWSNVNEARAAIKAGPAGSIFVLENTRFHPGEEENDEMLAKRMASLGDIYVNDAFSAAHRADASTEGVAKLLPNAAGRAMQAELNALTSGLGNPRRPVIALVGGAKVSTKIDLLENLASKVEALVIGGAMANTFLHAMGVGIGKSLAEKDLAETVRRIMDRATQARCAIILPIDAVVAWVFEPNAMHRNYGLDAMDPTGMILDVGPQSIERIKGALDEAGTLVWNGPLGAFETPPFDAATVTIAKHVANRTHAGRLVSVAGGGDTVAALAHAGVKDDLTYVSTAGGAFLEWMEGKALPGVEALREKPPAPEPVPPPAPAKKLPAPVAAKKPSAPAPVPVKAAAPVKKAPAATKPPAAAKEKPPAPAAKKAPVAAKKKAPEPAKKKMAAPAKKKAPATAKKKK